MARLACLAWLSACFSPSYSEGIECSEARTCPPGLTCDVRDNRCRYAPASGCVRDEDCDTGTCDTAMGICVPPPCGDGEVQPGEMCDPGIDPCCNDMCTGPVTAGVVCRAEVGPCDVAEVCDGESVACPADEPAEDGLACDECDGGACECAEGACASLCGNGRVDEPAGEECDLDEDARCPGHCRADCTCSYAATCLAYRDTSPGLPDGVYTIDPDGPGGLAPFDVRCDMTTDGGGWTLIEYAADLEFRQHFTDGDARRYLPEPFSLALDPAQVAAIQARSTEGFQRYVGLCEHVMHYYYRSADNYVHAFGFRFSAGEETPNGQASYAPFDIQVIQDGCQANGGEGGDPALATLFDIHSPLVPVVNVSSRDSGNAGELFGSPLTQNPARLR